MFDHVHHWKKLPKDTVSDQIHAVIPAGGLVLSFSPG